jgi:hypothetical protein
VRITAPTAISVVNNLDRVIRASCVRDAGVIGPGVSVGAQGPPGPGSIRGAESTRKLAANLPGLKSRLRGGTRSMGVAQPDTTATMAVRSVPASMTGFSSGSRSNKVIPGRVDERSGTEQCGDAIL